MKTVIFDIGNVLVHFSYQQMLERLAHHYNVPAERVRQMFVEEGLSARYESGKVSTEEMFLELGGLSALTPHSDLIVEAMGDIFHENSSIVPIVHALKKQGKRLIILSNTSPIHWNYIKENFSIVDLFDERVLSFEVGAIKPQKEIYEAALLKAACAPEECFYTDDIIEYVTIARTFGIDAEQYLDTPTLKKQLLLRMGDIFK